MKGIETFILRISGSSEQKNMAGQLINAPTSIRTEKISVFNNANAKRQSVFINNSEGCWQIFPLRIFRKLKSRGQRLRILKLNFLKLH